MKYRNKLRILSFAKFQALLFTLIGLLCGVFYAFGGVFIDALVSLDYLSSEAMHTPGLSFGTVLAFGALIGMPLIGGVIGFFTGMVEAILYNIFAKWIGYSSTLFR